MGQMTTVLEMVRSGASYATAAEAAGCSATTARSWCRANGVQSKARQTRPLKISDADKDKAMELVALWGVAAAAEKTGISISYLRQMANERGVTAGKGGVRGKPPPPQPEAMKAKPKPQHPCKRCPMRGAICVGACLQPQRWVGWKKEKKDEAEEEAQ